MPRYPARTMHWHGSWTSGVIRERWDRRRPTAPVWPRPAIASLQGIVMTTHRSTTSTTTRCRTGLALAAIAFAGTGLLACAEAAEEAGPSGAITHPEDDVIGSQVRLHE